VKRISPDRLRALRALDIEHVARRLGLAAAPRGRRRRFVCPCCEDCHTTLAASSNLAWCFRCQRGFNPIDLVIATSGYTFLEAVDYLGSMGPGA